MYELEHLSDEWEPYLENCWQILYGGKAAGYRESHEKFRAWCSWEQASFDLDIILEQLLIYFIFTYFCGAVYDDNVLGKVDMSLSSVYIIYEMMVAKWMEQGKLLTQHNIEQIVYQFSRELEHSDMNLELMETMH